jgi:uncharacterized membrane protein YhaH (DUF805 family)
MADIFVSYAREDHASAATIGRALEAQGLDVFWDSDIPPGKTWADYIEAKLAVCKVMVVLWSEHSTKSQWVREEARIGRDQRKLIPVLIEAVSVPLGFGEVQAANLSGWTGDTNHPEWRRFLGAVAAASGATLRPQPAYAAPSYQAPPAKAGNTPLVEDGQAGPVFYVRKCLGLYFSGAGRARRSEYWWWVLFSLAVIFVGAFLDALIFGVNPYTGAFNAPVFTALVVLALIAPTASVGVRRLHDVGLSGWLYLVGIIPYIGWLFMLVVGLMPSKPEANRYGPNPKLAVAAPI